MGTYYKFGQNLLQIRLLKIRAIVANWGFILTLLFFIQLETFLSLDKRFTDKKKYYTFLTYKQWSNICGLCQSQHFESREVFTLYITLFDLDMKTVESLLDVVTRVHFQAKKENENFIFFKKINFQIEEQINFQENEERNSRFFALYG